MNFNYKQESFYILSPNKHNDSEGKVPIYKIIEEYYGKAYNPLKSFDKHEHNNDSHILIYLEKDIDYEQALFDLDGGYWETDEAGKEYITYQKEVFL